MEIKPLKPLPGFRLGAKPDPIPRFKEEKTEEQRPMYWYGVYIQSNPEWWAIQWFLKNKIDFKFQFSLWGGDSAKGGVTIDFVVQLPPRPFPFELKGGHWHEGAKGAGDKIRDQRVAQYFKVPRVLAVYEENMQDQETLWSKMDELIL